jgi:hypothetical protein
MTTNYETMSFDTLSLLGIFILRVLSNYNNSHNKKARGALLPGLHFVAVALVVKA